MSIKNKPTKTSKKMNSLQNRDFTKYFHFISEIIETISLGEKTLLVSGNFVND